MTTQSLPENLGGRTFAWASACLAARAALVGIISFAGWALGIERLTNWYNTGISIQPNTTVALFSTGVGIMFFAFGMRRTGAVIGLPAAVAGFLALFQTVTGINLGTDTPLLFGRPWGGTATFGPGRTGVPASISLMLISAGLVLGAFGGRWRKLAPTCGIVVGAIVLPSLMGFL